MVLRHFTWVIMVLTACVGGGCETPSAFERNRQAHEVAAHLQAEFLKAVDASNHLVLATPRTNAGKLTQQAERAKAAVTHDTEALATLLRAPEYADELKLLEQFRAQFTAYDVLDREILGLAADNTNIKAQELSFGSGRVAADAFAASLATLAQGASGKEAPQIEIACLTACVSVREIQALQAPHIAETEDAKMTAIERDMKEREAKAEQALQDLAKLVGEAPSLARAQAEFLRFKAVHQQIIELSRRNTNVRSVAMSLGQKRTMIAACGETLQALIAAIARRNELPQR